MSKPKLSTLGDMLQQIYGMQDLSTNCIRQACCCRVSLPQMKYSEFLNISNRIWDEWSKEDRATLILTCVKYFFSKSLLRPCPLLSGFDCRIYEDRPLGCRAYGLWPADAYQRRVARFEKTLGLPKEQIPLNTQCPMVRRKKQTCPTCAGQGWYADGPTDSPGQKQCDSCQGTGKIAPPDLTEAQLDEMYAALDALDKKVGEFQQEKIDRHYNYRTLHDWILAKTFGEDMLVKFTNLLLSQDSANIDATIKILEEKVKEMI